MVSHSKTARNTKRLRVLESASAIFAKKGYRDATIAEICEHAGANVASVNYYFGDKKHLYDRVWRHALKTATENYPLDAGLNDGSSPEECLYAFVSGMLRRIFSKGPTGHFQRLMAREIAEPTWAHKDIVEKAIRPERKRLEGIISALLDGNEMKDQVLLCAMSVISQCLLLNMNSSGRRRNFSAQQIEPLARHITRFSLAGIREIKNLARETGSWSSI
jgi:AcrR family transcriptional regulator